MNTRQSAARFPYPLVAGRRLLLLACLTLGACASRPGHYYQDDGPPEHPPAGLAQMPDAVPRIEPLNLRANRPYTALGRSYTPDTSDAPFEQRGMASWYGRQYQGNPTASGEPYDMYAMTAAHPTLPIPSYARVTRASDGRSVIVRINDRGPFLQDRVIDLSYAAATRLGIVGPGSGEVRVRKITARDIAAGNVGSAAAPPAAVPASAEAPGLSTEAAIRSRDVASAGAGTAPHPATAPAASTTPVAPDMSVAADAPTTAAPAVALAAAAIPAAALSGAAASAPAVAIPGAATTAAPSAPGRAGSSAAPQAAAAAVVPIAAPSVPAVPSPASAAVASVPAETPTPANSAAVPPAVALQGATGVPQTSATAVAAPDATLAATGPVSGAATAATPATVPASPVATPPIAVAAPPSPRAVATPAAPAMPATPANPAPAMPPGPAPAAGDLPTASAKPPATSAGKWSVQLGAFSVLANAEALRDALTARLARTDADILPADSRHPRIEFDGRLHHVLVGAFAARAGAQRSARDLRRLLSRDTTLYRP
jgi:rare lipoprotein A